MAQLWVMEASGANPHQLLSDPSHDYQPAWSPDGKTIAFTMCVQVYCNVGLVDADGTNLRRLGLGLFPAWSPDGRTIAYECGDQKNDRGICLMDTSGANIRRLTDKRLQSSMPTWSPDGRFIAFDSNRDVDWQLYAMMADGSNVVRLTEGEDTTGFLSWGP